MAEVPGETRLGASAFVGVERSNESVDRAGLEWLSNRRADLRPWVRRMGVLLRRHPGPDGPGLGPLEGYDGVTNRGTLDRLLSSSLGISQAAPLEFARRAAEGELGYLAVRSGGLAPRRDRVVLLDAGPTQLGAPRVAQIAFLLALDRAAAKEGGRVRFGLLQDPAMELFPLALPDAIATLLKARCWDLPHAEQLRAFASRLAEEVEGRVRTEVYVLSDLDRFPEGVIAAADLTVLQTTEPVPGEPLDLQVRGGGGRPQKVRLPSLSAAVLLSALAGPLEGRFATIRVPRGGTGGFVFGPGGRCLLVADAKEGVRSIAVAGPARVGRTRALRCRGLRREGIWRPWRRVAVGLEPGLLSIVVSDRGLMASGVAGGTLRLEPARHRLSVSWERSGLRRATYRDGVQPAYLLQLPRGPMDFMRAVVFVDRRRAFVMRPEGEFEDRRGDFFCLAKGVLATARSASHSLRLVTRDAKGRTRLESYDLRDPAEARPVAFMGRSRGGVFLGDASARFPLVAVRHVRGGWSLWREHARVPIDVRDFERVVGVFDDARDPGLVVLAQDACRLSFVGREDRRVLVESAAPMNDVVVSPTQAVAAFRSQPDVITVVDLGTGRERLRMEAHR